MWSARGIVVTLAALAVLTTPGVAQRMIGGPGFGPEFGAHLGYNFDLDAATLGAQASLPMGRLVAFYPSMDYYTISGQTEWALNLDLALRAPGLPFWYAGAGANVQHLTFTGVSETTTRFEVLSGLEGRARGFRPYAEARLMLGNPDALQIVGGANIPLR